ncbi:hypothetical protein BBK36DRAFT_1138934 [Trichoderma citrinoviride]|uniref:Secreted protein n=1 Tax=Trichoderma citrinoviride TaxID=58853 RepID=A0A2T4BHT5_9HYPO|nr:hypothetical protein BBK36DRAFT_1138934 [Trichoderma citrinoviride]PTB68838.1 hypothetical protein BBK36DRAFT_1138934 [Trichoderma citrinoviride]
MPLAAVLPLLLLMHHWHFDPLLPSLQGREAGQDVAERVGEEWRLVVVIMPSTISDLNLSSSSTVLSSSLSRIPHISLNPSSTSASPSLFRRWSIIRSIGAYLDRLQGRTTVPSSNRANGVPYISPRAEYIPCMHRAV